MLLKSFTYPNLIMINELWERCVQEFGTLAIVGIDGFIDGYVRK